MWEDCENLIVRGKAFIGNRILKDVDIFIDEDTGRIKDIKTIGYYINDPYVLNYSKRGLIIFPGLIDMHAHLRDLDYAYKEDFVTGTAAAAAGGFTLVCDMPNTKPKTNSYNNLKLKLECAEKGALVDYGIYFGYPEKLDELAKVRNLIIGLKLYPDDIYSKNIVTLAKRAAIYNLIIVFHAEDPNFFIDTANPGFDRPAESEYYAVKYVMENIVKRLNYKLKIHFTHLSAYLSLKYIINLKKNTVNVTLDTAPHYFLLSNELYKIKEGFYKVYPPLKSRFDNLYILTKLREGLIDAVASDHAPHTLKEKEGDYYNASPGYSSMEVIGSILTTLLNFNMLSISDFIKLISENPAKILGLFGDYGIISPGAYANFSIFNLKERWVVDPDKFYSKAKHSPYAGWELIGKPVSTIIRGKVVYEYGDVNFSLKGIGKNVKRKTQFSR